MQLSMKKVNTLADRKMIACNDHYMFTLGKCCLSYFRWFHPNFTIFLNFCIKIQKSKYQQIQNLEIHWHFQNFGTCAMRILNLKDLKKSMNNELMIHDWCHLKKLNVKFKMNKMQCSRIFFFQILWKSRPQNNFSCVENSSISTTYWKTFVFLDMYSAAQRFRVTQLAEMSNVYEGELLQCC